MLHLAPGFKIKNPLIAHRLAARGFGIAKPHRNVDHAFLGLRRYRIALRSDDFGLLEMAVPVHIDEHGYFGALAWIAGSVKRIEAAAEAFVIGVKELFELLYDLGCRGGGRGDFGGAVSAFLFGGWGRRGVFLGRRDAWGGAWGWRCRGACLRFGWRLRFGGGFGSGALGFWLWRGARGQCPREDGRRP